MAINPEIFLKNVTFIQTTSHKNQRFWENFKKGEGDRKAHIDPHGDRLIYLPYQLSN